MHLSRHLHQILLEHPLKPQISVFLPKPFNHISEAGTYKSPGWTNIYAVSYIPKTWKPWLEAESLDDKKIIQSYLTQPQNFLSSAMPGQILSQILDTCSRLDRWWGPWLELGRGKGWRSPSDSHMFSKLSLLEVPKSTDLGIWQPGLNETLILLSNRDFELVIKLSVCSMPVQGAVTPNSQFLQVWSWPEGIPFVDWCWGPSEERAGSGIN